MTKKEKGKLIVKIFYTSLFGSEAGERMANEYEKKMDEKKTERKKEDMINKPMYIPE